MNVMNIIDEFTFIACLVIVCAFLLSLVYVIATDNARFAKRKKWIGQLPSVVSTLGVLGTFLGITKGLISFDTDNLDTSIPLLLDGLKTAFFTSLIGMFCSLILNRVVSHKFDAEEKESDVQQAARRIVQTLVDNQKNLPSMLRNSNKDMVELFLREDDVIKAIKLDVEQLKDDIEEMKGHIEEMKGQNAAISDATNALTEELSRLRAVLVTATASIAAIDNNTDEIKGAIKNIETTSSILNENVGDIRST